MTAVLIKIFLFCTLCSGMTYADHYYKRSTHFYKDIGCVKNEKYINAFDCPEFPSKNGSCRFENHFIKSGENIPQELLKGSCLPECKCNEDGLFSCPGTDCGLVSQIGCHSRHSFDSCCSVGLVCGENVAKCEIEGKTYKEGEKMYLKESCDVCICDKDFKKEAPFCRPIKCNVEAISGQDLAEHGAPVYLKTSKFNCCPSLWITDDVDDKIEIILEDVETNPPVCKFGKKEIKLAHGFRRLFKRSRFEAKLLCECHTPPFVTCKEI